MLDPEAPPPWAVAEWFNCHTPLTLDALRGRVVVMILFQTHCNGSRQHALPQAERLWSTYDHTQLAVVGINSPFENKASQSPEAVKAFVRANKLGFPVGIDAAAPSGLPVTMEMYAVQGTPAVLIYDRQGRLRRHYLGGVDDIRLSAELMAFLIEGEESPREISVGIERMLSASLTEPESHTRQHSRAAVPGGQIPWHLPNAN